MSTITLVQYRIDHIDGLLQLSRRLETDALPCSYWGMDLQAAKQLSENPSKTIFVALNARNVVGVGTLTRGEDYQRHLAEISIAIDPGFRRQGIAQRIVARLEAAAREQNIELLKALISTTNLPSRRLFESLQFEHRATLYCEFKSPEFGEIDDCVYYKRLALV